MAKKRERPERRQATSASAISADPAAQSNRWYWAIATAVTLAVAFFVYSPAAQGPFVLDDRYQYFGRPEASQVGFFSWIASVRPLLNASFWLNYQLSGTSTASYHYLNVFIHALTSLMVLVLMRQLWQRANSASPAPRETALPAWAPIAAAAVFLLHPLQTESVAYISSRSESLSVLFAFSALAIQLGGSQAALSIVRILGMLVCLGLAVLTKEHAAVMPAIFLLTDYFWRGGWPAIKANWKLHAGMAAAGIAALAFVARTLSTSPSAGFGIDGPTPSAYLFTQFRMYWRYIRMLVLPAGLNADPDLAISHSLADPGALAGLVGILAVLAAAWFLRRKAPLASYGIVVFTLLLAPTSSFIPILDVFAERRVYLPMLGICCLILEALRRWRIPAAAVAAVLALYAIGTFQRSAVWASEVGLWQDSVAGSPNKYRPHFQLAYAQYLEGHCAEANRDFEAASKLVDPKAKPDVTLLVDWALSLDCAGKPTEALAKLSAATRMEDSAHVRSLIGMVNGKNGHPGAALTALDAAQHLDPNFAMTYVYRGSVYATQNRFADAQAEYQHALALDPTNIAAAQGLASIRGR